MRKSADLLAWVLQLYYAPPNKFAILHCGICRPRGVGLQLGAGVCNLTMPH